MEKYFEKFEIIEVLKKDIHTAVYLANHIFLGKKIILKTLNTNEIADPAIVNRFKREAKILARLDHPNIIKVLDFGMFQEYFYISFEFFKSSNLRELLRTNHLTFEKKQKLTHQIIKGLNAAHSANIIHRDIKPENILTNENMELKIADFGLAVQMDDNLLTNKSSIVGTPAYMSPEQIRGEKLTQQSDLFSAGIVIYELFKGKNPFLGKDINTTLNNILTLELDNQSVETDDIDNNIIKCIFKMLQKDKKQRYDSAKELLQILKISEEANDIHEITSKFSYKNWIPIAGTGIIIFFIVYVYIFSNNQSTRPDKIDADPNMKFIETPKLVKSDEINSTANEDKETEPQAPVMKSEPEKIHINNEEKIKKNNIRKKGKLYFESIPWTDIYIDEKKVPATPENKYIELSAGLHVLKLVKQGFPEYQQNININSGDVTYFRVNLDTLFGYLDFKIYPWADVFIDSFHIGQSPFLKPIKIKPGIHSIAVTNPEYKRYVSSIKIAKKETLLYKINLEDLLKENN